MPMKQRENLLLVALFTLLLVLTSCNDTKALSPQKQFGDNAYYFMGLSSLQKGQKDEALSHFKKGVKKSDDFFAEKCMESLCQLTSANEKKILAQELAQGFPSPANQLNLAQILYAAEEYDQILSIGGVGAESSTDREALSEEEAGEAMYLRLLALGKEGKQGFAGEIEDWFFYTPITSFHKKISLVGLLKMSFEVLRMKSKPFIMGKEKTL